MITDQEFRIALIQMTEGMDIGYVANHLLVSHPTVRRWKAGTNLPHPAMRPSLIKDLENLKNGCAIENCETCKFYKVVAL